MVIVRTVLFLILPPILLKHLVVVLDVCLGKEMIGTVRLMNDLVKYGEVK